MTFQNAQRLWFLAFIRLVDETAKLHAFEVLLFYDHLAGGFVLEERMDRSIEAIGTEVVILAPIPNASTRHVREERHPALVVHLRYVSELAKHEDTVLVRSLPVVVDNGLFTPTCDAVADGCCIREECVQSITKRALGAQNEAYSRQLNSQNACYATGDRPTRSSSLFECP